MSMLALAEPDGLLAHYPLGVSTGFMGASRGDWSRQVAEALEVSPFAIELSALSETELNGLERYLAGNPRLPFRYVSIHGPSKGRSMPESELLETLLRFAPHAHAIVMHPDTIQDPQPYRVLGRNLVLENMDSRKEAGRTAEELARWFAALPEAGFCFDVAHAWSIDPTMRTGGELLDAFRTRLRHVHVSSMDPALHHVPLSEEDEQLFMPLLHRCVDVPWILEAPPRRD